MADDNGSDSSRSPKVYTVKDVARLLKFDRDKIYDLNKRGEMPKPLPLGRSLRWNGGEIDRWVDKGCPPPKKRKRIRDE